MSRWKQKLKKWHDRQSRLGNKRKYSRVHYISYHGDASSAIRTRASDGRPVVILKPPKSFSLTSNTEETMSFFMDFANAIDRKEYGTQFLIDSREVEFATVDALIYLIAILQNDKVNNSLHYSFVGNYPLNEEANRIYAESGFNDYVVSKMRKLPDSTDTMKIISGDGNSPTAAKELCNFVMANLGKTRKDIQPIQKVLIELMSNVFHHAYEKNTFLAKKWYMYAEHVNDYIRCVFVDTGYGIAKTARKNFSERIKILFGLKVDDSKIIKSIFEGEFRTATNEPFRGNGLLSVRQNVETDVFDSFEVISGRGRCIVPKDNQEKIVSVSFKNVLYGTLYQFIIR